MTPCDYFDLVVIVFLIFGIFWGATRGFISSLAVLLATSIGVLTVHRFHKSIIQLLDLEPTRPALCIVSFAIFALSSMVVYQIMHTLESFIHRRRLMAWNRILGLIFGFAVSACGCWIGAWILTEFPQTRTSVTHSRSAKYLVLLAEFGKESFPPLENAPWQASLAKYPDKFIERVNEDAKLPLLNEAPEDQQNTGVRQFLDAVDQHFSVFLQPPNQNPDKNSNKIHDKNPNGSSDDAPDVTPGSSTGKTSDEVSSGPATEIQA